MLGRSLLLEREMRNLEQVQGEIGGIFIKLSVSSPPPQRLGEKIRCGFSSHPFFTSPIWFSAFRIINISCSFHIERFYESVQGGTILIVRGIQH